MRVPKVLLAAVMATSFFGTAVGAGNDPPPAAEQGVVKGKVTLKHGGAALHKARVLIVQLGRSAETNEEGEFEFAQVPAGTYEVMARSAALGDERRTVEVRDGATATVNFELGLAVVREHVTVTATGSEQATFEALMSVTTLEPVDLIQKAQPSIGDVLEGQPGVAKRGFGVGNSRPVLRGFDGDRVLVLLDGMNAGSLASQSGDHGENLDATSLESIEIVRGPATLLYGSNAIGGVVSAFTGLQTTHEHPHEGLSGFVSGAFGSTNDLAGGGAGFEYGWSKWAIRGGTSGQRTGDYDTPIGEIANSQVRNAGGRGGFGYYGDRGFFSFGYDYDDRRYGIPFAVFFESGGADGGFIAPENEVINLRLRRHDVKLTGGARNLDAPITDIRAALGFTDYRHGEFDDQSLGTDFFNRQVNYRVTFEQRRAGLLRGTFGVSGTHRDFDAFGTEAIAPPVLQNNFALFALETVDFSRLSLQFGGRFEHVGYEPGLNPLLPVSPSRSFNGFSGGAGIRVPLWKGGAFVANYTHSFRAPALEELYNNGDHPGNVTFEIGNPLLERELGNGVDFSVRHQAQRFRAEVNFYYYALTDFVFLTPTGNLAPSGFIEAEFLQGDTRYAGVEANFDAQVRRGLWLFGGLDVTNAELTSSITSPSTGQVTPADTPLPRIPPVRGRLGIDLRWKGLSVRPEGVFARDQNDIFPTETPTPGYALANLTVSYTVPRAHSVSVFSVHFFNLGDRLYRNHLSFIKDLAPEIGRGVRVSATVRFQ